MRSIDDLAFIRDRVIREWVTDRQPAGPILGELPPAETCRRGHSDWVQYPGQRKCRTCQRNSLKARRARRMR